MRDGTPITYRINCDRLSYLYGTNSHGTQNLKPADIAFLNLPKSMVNVQRVYAGVSNQIVVKMTTDNSSVTWRTSARRHNALSRLR
jgi:hypothetical protein